MLCLQFCSHQLPFQTKYKVCMSMYALLTRTGLSTGRPISSLEPKSGLLFMISIYANRQRYAQIAADVLYEFLLTSLFTYYFYLAAPTS